MEQAINEKSVQIHIEPEVRLSGSLSIPFGAQGIILFAHGSGSSRHSPRNQFVAYTLNYGRMGTLLIDLLTPNEELVDMRTRHLRFNIELLASRLIGAIDWLHENPESRSLKIGIFGASTGAAAAMVAASRRPKLVSAVVSRGGRPDLAGSSLSKVNTPTLLIVGSNDIPVLEMNRMAMERMKCPKELEIIQGASHLFEEPGKLKLVARSAQKWFSKHLSESLPKTASHL